MLNVAPSHGQRRTNELGARPRSPPASTAPSPLCSSAGDGVRRTSSSRSERREVEGAAGPSDQQGPPSPRWPISWPDRPDGPNPWLRPLGLAGQLKRNSSGPTRSAACAAPTMDGRESEAFGSSCSHATHVGQPDRMRFFLSLSPYYYLPFLFLIFSFCFVRSSIIYSFNFHYIFIFYMWNLLFLSSLFFYIFLLFLFILL